MRKVQYWLDEINESGKREKDFREKGKNILEIYEGKKTPFNILYSNTETLLPALFSQLPKPVIGRRFKDSDPLGKVVSEAGQRVLEYLLDTDLDEYDSFSDALTDVTLDALLPGRGNASVKYESDDDVTWETACIDVHAWDRVHYGYAKKWSKMPWVAFEYYFDEDEAKEKFDDITGIEFREGEEVDEKDEKEKVARETALFYQIWVKKDRKIYWVSDQVKDRYLDEIDDPLELSGFYPCPKPLQFIKKSSDLVPTALYTLYENQASELNKIQGRINKVVEAIKVRGVYNRGLGDIIGTLFEEADNTLVPTDDVASLADGSIDKAIWFAPIEKLIVVLQQLYQARESSKTVIYEITGISDIVRGQSVASETLGAQQIKESWGTMRLKRLQKEVQRYALDLMKLLLEVSAKKFSEETWQKITMLPNPTSKEKEEAQQQLQALQIQAQQSAMLSQRQGMQPQPPQFPPELQQAAQSPSFKDILDILNDDFQRSYRIDIESNSTLDVDATEDKQMVGEFMNALAQVMSGFANDQTIPFQAKKSIILAVTKRFRFGREVEDELESMQEPQPQIPPQIQQQIQEQQKQIQQGQQQIQKAQQDIEKEKQRLEMERMQFDFDTKLAKEQLNFEEDLATEKLKMDEQLAKERLKLEKLDAESSLKQMFTKAQRDIQSMLDRHAAMVKS